VVVAKSRRLRAVSLRGQGYLVSWPRQLERPADREQLRRRVLAFAGIWFLVAGMLAALGVTIVLLASLAVVLVVGVVVAALWLIRRYELGRAIRVARPSIERASERVGPSIKQASGKVRPSIERASGKVTPSIEQASRKLRTSFDELDAGQRLGRLANRAAQQARHALEVRPRPPAAPDPRRQARRLNEAGAQLRREGDYEGAAEQHRSALAIVRELDDPRTEALTLNNLALALVHTGSVSVAVEHFEQALVLLREVGDERHEGQVIANLGFVRRRQGRDEDARSLLTAALDKLPPESSAYRQVEEQLRRAS
jgi:tetratricopeptide (TPR) repeat protein